MSCTNLNLLLEDVEFVEVRRCKRCSLQVCACSFVVLYNPRMHLELRAESLSPAQVAALLPSHSALEAEVETLKRERGWVDKQLFGSKSERRLIEVSPDQRALGERLQLVERAVAPVRPVSVYTRGSRQSLKNDEDATSGSRFNDSVPVEVIEIGDPEIEGLVTGTFEIIGEKVAYRVAQQRGCHVVLKYVRKLIEHKGAKAIFCPQGPAGVVERSQADVSLLAGPDVSRQWLTQFVHKAACSLEPVSDARLASIREISIITMDETPTEVSRK